LLFGERWMLLTKLMKIGVIIMGIATAIDKLLLLLLLLIVLIVIVLVFGPL
jgi:hypothetical protein